MKRSIGISIFHQNQRRILMKMEMSRIVKPMTANVIFPVLKSFQNAFYINCFIDVFNPAIAETPEAKMTDLNLQTPSQGCLCIWRKIVCTNVYMKNLNFVPTEVEYL